MKMKFIISKDILSHKLRHHILSLLICKSLLYLRKNTYYAYIHKLFIFMPVTCGVFTKNYLMKLTVRLYAIL